MGSATPRPRSLEAIRAGIGAALALAMTGGLLMLMSGWRTDCASFVLIAPLGVSAFLLFAVPNWPLAQPWPPVIGNTVLALVAAAVLQKGLPAEITAGVAVGLSILAMASLRARQPPAAQWPTPSRPTMPP
ncbi:MAG: HPP family protein [Erythrobacter sp.]